MRRAPGADIRALSADVENHRHGRPSRRIRLFSYGTLQLPEVQRDIYGRLLEGQPDSLAGYTLEPLRITDHDVVRLSGLSVHSIARRTGDSTDVIEGTVFELTAPELEATDRYEVDAARRQEVSLASGMRAFVYVRADLASE